ncbi:MAG: 2Fe-2S iron-sulfur cluster-binding protein [Halobacteria archaeon]
MGKKHKINLVFEGREIECDEEQTILDACEKNGVMLDFNCREGTCTTCAGKLREGRVDQWEAIAINDAQKARGYILTCVARPRSNCTVETGCMHELEE